MTGYVILEYRRPNGEAVTLSYMPGRVMFVHVDNELEKEIFVNQRKDESIQDCASRLAREWQAADLKPSVKTEDKLTQAALECFASKIADRRAGNGPIDTIEVDYLDCVLEHVRRLEVASTGTEILRRIVGLWDSLDAIGPKVPAAPLKARMDALIDTAREILEQLAEQAKDEERVKT